MAAVLSLLLLRSSHSPPSASPPPPPPPPLSMSRSRPVDTSLCRVCLKKGDIPIFTEGVMNNKAADLRTLCQLEISEDDNFPKFLCLNCNILLESAVEFRQTAIMTDEILRKKSCKRKPKNKNKSYPCSKCEMKFPTVRELKEHRLTEIHKNLRVKCRKCKIEFPNLKELQEHRLTDSHINLRIPCEICNLSFKRECMKSHMIVRHSGAKPHLCDVCGKSFPLKSTMYYHRTKHTKQYELRFVCKDCPYVGRSRWRLKEHTRVHTGEKPYACPFCPLTFADHSNRNAHKLTHQQIFKHKCIHCDKGFNRVGRMKQHVDAEHLGIKPYGCSECGKAFGYKKNLVQHSKIHIKK